MLRLPKLLSNGKEVTPVVNRKNISYTQKQMNLEDSFNLSTSSGYTNNSTSSSSRSSNQNSQYPEDEASLAQSWIIDTIDKKYERIANSLRSEQMEQNKKQDKIVINKSIIQPVPRRKRFLTEENKNEFFSLNSSKQLMTYQDTIQEQRIDKNSSFSSQSNFQTFQMKQPSNISFSPTTSPLPSIIFTQKNNFKQQDIMELSNLSSIDIFNEKRIPSKQYLQLSFLQPSQSEKNLKVDYNQNFQNQASSQSIENPLNIQNKEFNQGESKIISKRIRQLRGQTSISIFHTISHDQEVASSEFENTSQDMTKNFPPKSKGILKKSDNSQVKMIKQSKKCVTFEI